MSKGTYAKVQGIKFDALEGFRIVADSNLRNIKDAGNYAHEHDDKDTIWVIIPCEYQIP